LVNWGGNRQGTGLKGLRRLRASSARDIANRGSTVMKKILATIQEKQFSNVQIKALESVVRRHYTAHVGVKNVLVIWCIIPKGQAYTNYQPSQSSLISMECDNGFDQEKRITLLQNLELDWTAITGQDSNHVMISLIDSDVFNVVLDGNRERLTSVGRVKLQVHMMSSLLRSKLLNGFLSFRPNL
jgi:hypothetical protein